jgi:hypothetical protein
MDMDASFVAGKEEEPEVLDPKDRWTHSEMITGRSPCDKRKEKTEGDSLRFYPGKTASELAAQSTRKIELSRSASPGIDESCRVFAAKLTSGFVGGGVKKKIPGRYWALSAHG